MIYDQIQAGVGTSDDSMVPLAGKKGAVGLAVRMDAMIKEMDGRILACLYCGTGFYNKDATNVNKKICAMVQKMKADIVICGPCFNFEAYASMALNIACAIQSTTNIPVISAMSQEMSECIEGYKAHIPIVKMPKKGGTGLQDALCNILVSAKHMVEGKDIVEVKEKYCYV